MQLVNQLFKNLPEKKQLEKFLTFNENNENSALLVNNYDWMKGLSFLDFIRICLNLSLASHS